MPDIETRRKIYLYFRELTIKFCKGIYWSLVWKVKVVCFKVDFGFVFQGEGDADNAEATETKDTEDKVCKFFIQSL